MYSHMMVGSNDIDRSKAFYDALFASVGGKPGIVDPKGRIIYMHNGGM
ncbi:MAG: VOC family protein, partial [Novosphingobium sp.]